MGMLPNRFQDNGEAPEYNNVDGTLWYFVAVYQIFGQATGDQIIYPGRNTYRSLSDIIDWHYKGTRYQYSCNMKMDYYCTLVKPGNN